MIIKNKRGCRVVDLMEYTIAEINKIYDFWTERGFCVECE